MKTLTALAFTALYLTPLRADEAFAGKFPEGEYLRINQAGGEEIKSIRTSPETLSKEDQKLLNEIAAIGASQLAASKTALEKAFSPGVKVIAKAEVDEQMELSAKLKEIAAAKKVQLATKPSAQSAATAASLKKQTGRTFDAAYLNGVAISSHEALLKVVTRAKESAKDPNLKELAKTTLPMVQLHLAAAKDEAAKLEEALSAASTR